MLDYKETLQAIRKRRLVHYKTMVKEMGVTYNTFLKWKNGQDILDLTRFKIERYLEEQAHILKP